MAFTEPRFQHQFVCLGLHYGKAYIHSTTMFFFGGGVGGLKGMPTLFLYDMVLLGSVPILVLLSDPGF